MFTEVELGSRKLACVEPSWNALKRVHTSWIDFEVQVRAGWCVSVGIRTSRNGLERVRVGRSAVIAARKIPTACSD